MIHKRILSAASFALMSTPQQLIWILQPRRLPDSKCISWLGTCQMNAPNVSYLISQQWDCVWHSIRTNTHLCFRLTLSFRAMFLSRRKFSCLNHKRCARAKKDVFSYVPLQCWNETHAQTHILIDVPVANDMNCFHRFVKVCWSRISRTHQVKRMCHSNASRRFSETHAHMFLVFDWRKKKIKQPISILKKLLAPFSLIICSYISQTIHE